ncbi:hypothetical protein ACFRAO_39985 [Streptomyces sp. NPDC056656]|uniref:SCO4983 family protein n=1 Tax=Streptomyces sp. NPDC056656 TaxID=3345895 RepID=UPI00367C0165
MYEPTRTGSSRRSVHATADPGDFPHRSREEELDIQLAGHLAALLALTDELRAFAPDPDLDAAADDLAHQVARLRWGSPLLERSRELGGGLPPARASVADAGHEPRIAALHQRAHALAGRALVVAASRADTAAAILAARRMEAHAAAGQLVAS